MRESKRTMAKDTIAYVVRSGDHIEEIAHRFGATPEEIRADPSNADLADKRGDMSMLCAGDVLYVPKRERKFLPLTVGATNKLVAKIPKVDIHLDLVDGQDPIMNAPYTIDGAGEQIQGTTDAVGHVSFSVPVTARTVHLVLTDTGRSFDVSVGGLDPLEETSGVQMRLAHLGLYNGPLDGRLSDHTRAGVMAFQAQQKLAPTGELDDKTLAALKDAHGA